ncbi:signal recognition particle receptor FtsY [bacterium BMS3Bbin03]|nr:signal recognition particle receptor FtsY [bacterium BMS3Bbin03]
MALFGKLRSGLTKTRTGILGRIKEAVTGKKTLDEETLDAIEEILITSDIGVETVMELLERLRKRARIKGEDETAEIQDIMRQELKSVLSDQVERSASDEKSFFNPGVTPFVIMVVGVNGTGKTTTIGKLAHRFRKEGKSVIIAAGDTFRAGASEQLNIWAERSGSDFVRHQAGADPGAVVFDALNAAVARRKDVLIVDTAGRLHTKVNLMEELKKIRRVMTKLIPEAPHETLLVLDATTGQNSIRQAEQFRDIVGLTGIVLTKLDGTAKGGVVLTILKELGIPVKFIGLGEGIEDLAAFDLNTFIDALFSENNQT